MTKTKAAQMNLLFETLAMGTAHQLELLLIDEGIINHRRWNVINMTVRLENPITEEVEQKAVRVVAHARAKKEAEFSIHVTPLGKPEETIATVVGADNVIGALHAHSLVEAIKEVH